MLLACRILLGESRVLMQLPLEGLGLAVVGGKEGDIGRRRGEGGGDREMKEWY